jgi:hypothetical protein
MEIAIIAILVLVAFGAIAVPLLRGTTPGLTDAASDATVDEEVARYRSALRANTVCKRCGQANPAASRFCFECGRTLAAADAEEFEGTGTEA